MSVDCIMPARTAALLLAWLEAHGAIVTLNEDDLIRADLDALDDLTVPPRILAGAIFSCASDIRRLLIARRTLQ